MEPKSLYIRKESIILLIDTFIIFLNISNSYSIIPYLVFFQYYRAINTGFITIINVFYLIYRFRASIRLESRDNLFYLYFIISVLNVIFGYITGTYGIGMLPFIFSNSTFYILLYNLFKEYRTKFDFEQSIWLIVRGYIFLCVLSITSVLILFFLIKIFDVYPLVNDIGDRMDLFKGNLERNPNVSYYYPFGIAIIEKTPFIKIPFFQEYGIIHGLFHEPHTFTFLVVPSIFLVFRKLKRKLFKIITIAIYVLIILIASSTTNILAFLLCLVVFLFVKHYRNLVVPIAILILSIIIFLFIDKSIYSFIVDKLNSRSAEYSIAIIKFAFTPKTLIGTSFYDLSYWDQEHSDLNVGYIIFFLNFIFLSLFIYKIFKLNISLDIQKRIIGLFVLYFLLHSMKVTMYSYSLSYLLLVIFLVNTYSKVKNKELVEDS